MLTDEQLRLREPFDATGSFLPPLCAGDGEVINRQYRQRLGLPVDPFEETWPMKFGSHNEQLVLDHVEQKHGHALSRRGEVVAHPTNPRVGVTLDAYRAADNWAIQVKCIGAWQSIPWIMEYYTCQAMLEAECIGADGASILLCHGGAEPAEYPIFVNADYRDQVWSRIDSFISCIDNLTEPYPKVLAPLLPIIPPEQWRRINLDQDADAHNWAAEMMTLLTTWDQTTDAAKANELAKTSIKTVLPDDVGHLTFAGIVISRAKNSAVSIKRAKV